MKKNGLCSTCVKEKSCIFTGKYLILECEEFSDNEVDCVHAGSSGKGHTRKNS